VHDVAITDIHAESPTQTAGKLPGTEDQVRMWVVDRGAWTIGGSPGPRQYTVPTGQFLLRRVGRPSHFHIAAHTTAKLIVLPAAALTPLLGNRAIAGPTDSAEARLLVAHASTVQATAPDLSQAGLQAARSTLIELAMAVARGRLDDTEPQLAPALAQAAKDLAERRLANPDLSPALLAHELHVSVRTLQRAFAATGEPAAAYIRRRRLEEARVALTSPSNHLTITELAAYWQFADSSHFTRAFKTRYGQTPTEYARRWRASER
jgi:AraC-like DNA-binding protein